MKVICSTGDLVDITLEGERFFLNGMPARISQIDIELELIEIQLGEILAVLSGSQFQLLEGVIGNTPTTLEAAAIWKATHLKAVQDRADEKDLLAQTHEIIVSDRSFICTWPDHNGREQETKKLVITQHLAVPGQYIMVPICNECWGLLSWRAMWGQVAEDYKPGKE